MEKVPFRHGELIAVTYRGEGGTAGVIAIQKIVKIMGRQFQRSNVY